MPIIKTYLAQYIDSNGDIREEATFQAKTKYLAERKAFFIKKMALKKPGAGKLKTIVRLIQKKEV